jgi:hypothetical protein
VGQIRGWIFCVSSCLVLVFVTAAAAWGQTTASLRGTVTDQSGGVVAGAKVTAVNTGTDLSRSTATGSDGGYLFNVLPVGKYKVTVEKSGFTTFAQTGIVLELTQAARLDVSLKVGTSTQTVEVTGNVAQVDTTTAALGKVENERAIRDLPLLDRDTLQLGLLQAGVFAPDPDDSSGNPFSVSGQRSESITFLLDGANNTDFLGNNIVVSPNPDAVEEFRILTNNYDAEYGRTSGGIVNQITKSGTNALHGDVFEFFRNNVLNATDYLLSTKAEYRRNVFGGTLGGAIKKDKTFFFVAYQGARRGEGMVPSPIAVLSNPERTGDFSDICPNPNGGSGFSPGGICQFTPAQDPSFTGVQLFDPTTGNPYAFNKVPVNPVIQNYINKFLPPPNQGTNIFSASPLAAINDDQGIVRIDHNLTARDTLSFSYLIDDSRAFFPEEGGTIISSVGSQPSGNGGDVPIGSGGFEKDRNQIGTFTWTHTFDSGKVNQFRFGASRFGPLGAAPQEQTAPSSLGFTNVTPADAGVPAAPTIFGPSFTLGPSVQGPRILHRANFEWSDNFTMTRGKHELKFGVDITRIRNNFSYDFYNSGGFDFTFGNFTGNEYADFVAGFFDNYFQSSPAIYGIRTGSFAGFAQDTWKLRPRLTLNYGLRYEYYVPQHDIHNNILGWFPGKQSSVFPGAPANVLYPGDPGTPNSALLYPDYNNFAPRFGFAWDMLGNAKLIMRGGFGIFYDIEDGGLNEQFGGQPPFGFQGNITPLAWDGSVSDCTGPLACGSMKDPWTPFGQANPYPFTPNGSFLVPPLQFAYVVYPHFRTPYSENYNYGFQWQATKDTMVEAVYVGSLGRKLVSTGELNFPQPSVMQHQLDTYLPAFEAGLIDSPVNPECARQYSACTGGIINPADPFDPSGSPTGSQQILTNFSNGLSDSHQLQLTVDKRFGEGLMFRAAYTLAKTIDLTSGFRSRSGQYTDPLDQRLDRGLADFDARQRLVLSLLYVLPFDRAIQSDGILKKVAEGWQVNTIATFQAGNPITFYSNSNASFQNQNPDLTRVDIAGKPMYMNPRRVPAEANQPSNDCNSFATPSSSAHFWIDPTNMECAACPFTDPSCTGGDSGIPLFTYGNLGRNSVRGPGINNWDISLVKKTGIGEGSKSVEFRAEFFNAFNHTQFLRIDNAGGSSTFGQVLTDRGPRLIQFGLKFYF